MIFVPADDYAIDRALRITADNTGLWGYGRIIQTNPDESIVEIYRESAAVSGVRIVALTLLRADNKQESHRHGILASECKGFELNDVRVIDNRSGVSNVPLSP